MVGNYYIFQLIIALGAGPFCIHIFAKGLYWKWIRIAEKVFYSKVPKTKTPDIPNCADTGQSEGLVGQCQYFVNVFALLQLNTRNSNFQVNMQYAAKKSTSTLDTLTPYYETYSTPSLISTKQTFICLFGDDRLPWNWNWTTCDFQTNEHGHYLTSLCYNNPFDALSSDNIFMYLLLFRQRLHEKRFELTSWLFSVP